MQIVLQQLFPLGRFHATPWRANPFDDAFGEWPPSPWRLVRAVVARWYQWRRESIDALNEGELDPLVRALCDSSYRFHLPVLARRGDPLRQYHPVELEMDPPNFKAHSAMFATPQGSLSDDLRTRLTLAGAAEVGADGSGLHVRVSKPKEKKKIEALLGKALTDWRGLSPDPGLRSYGTSLVQDNYWCVPRDAAGAVWWFIEGDRWTEQLAQTLDRCLERVVYFGRAETLTEIRRAVEPVPEPNCQLLDRPHSDAVRVLVPDRAATCVDVERVTDDPDVAGRSVPPGALVMYAVLPRSTPARERGVVHPFRTDCHLFQLAIGWNVPPEPRVVVRLTSRFRSAVLRELLRIKTGGGGATWSTAGTSVRGAVADMLGKNADGKPLDGHRHAEFLAWWEGALPTRLMVWRGARPFDQDEQTAILRAASQELSWAAIGQDADAWKVRVVPLDASVPPPPGFDGTRAEVWESVTPFVPSRHHLRGGKPRDPESLLNQIRRELVQRGMANSDSVEVEQSGQATWVAVHVPRRSRAKSANLGDRRGYWLRLKFSEPISGPLRLGHSSSFGLGLFMPIA